MDIAIGVFGATADIAVLCSLMYARFWKVSKVIFWIQFVQFLEWPLLLTPFHDAAFIKCFAHGIDIANWLLELACLLSFLMLENYVVMAWMAVHEVIKAYEYWRIETYGQFIFDGVYEIRQILNIIVGFAIAFAVYHRSEQIAQGEEHDRREAQAYRR